MVDHVSSVLQNMAEHVYAKFVQVRTSSYAEFVSIFWFEIQTTSYCNRLALYMLRYKEAAVTVA